MPLAGVTRQIGHVLVRLAGDEQPVILEKIGAVGVVLPLFLDQSSQYVDEKGDPPGGGLDEADAEPWELLGDFVRDEIAEGDERQHAAGEKAVVALDVDQVEQASVGDPCMDADREVEV